MVVVLGGDPLYVGSTSPYTSHSNHSFPLFYIETSGSLRVVSGHKYLTPYVIYYRSKKLTPTKLNYMITEKEFLDVVHAINKFQHYITSYKNFIHINHSSIRHLMNKPITNGRITRWLLLLQEFNITILDRPRKENTNIDFISRIHNDNIDTDVKDNFPNEYSFAVSTKTPWFVDFSNYLATVKFPPQLSSK